jgi:hypothetical protein
MRTTARGGAVLFILLASAACDKDEKSKQLAQQVGGSASATAAQPSASSAAPAASAQASGAPTSSLKMPERPIPKPQTMVGAGMPIETQQKAIQYMVAMRAPRPDEANADPTYAAELANKLKPIIMGMDKGANKAKFNRVEVVANGRQIDLFMSGGCDERTPQHAIQNAGATSTLLVSHGVLVVRCNDEQHQCLQSTRDPDDVLCTTAPRHK